MKKFLTSLMIVVMLMNMGIRVYADEEPVSTETIEETSEETNVEAPTEEEAFTVEDTNDIENNEENLEEVTVVNEEVEEPIVEEVVEEEVQEPVVEETTEPVVVPSEELKNGWINENGKKYYYVNGSMRIGQQKIGNDWYVFDVNTGEMKTGFVFLGSEYHAPTDTDKTAYYDPNTGKMLKGQRLIDGYWYMFDIYTGAMKTGFVYIKEQSKTVYYDAQGKMLKGQRFIDGYWYMFDQVTGAMKTGFVDIPSQNKRVYYNASGKMVKGQAKIGNDWYMFDQITGAMKTGFVHIKEQKKTVYYNKQGKMLKGQQCIDGKWYLFHKVGGGMKTGFMLIDSEYQSAKEAKKVVYYNDKGQMLYGHQVINGVSYYFNTVTGAREVGWHTVNGTQYLYQTLGGRISYADILAKGRTFIGKTGECTYIAGQMMQYIEPGSWLYYDAGLKNVPLVKQVTKAQAKAGSFVEYYQGNSFKHVGVYLGNGHSLQGNWTGGKATVMPLNSVFYETNSAYTKKYYQLDYSNCTVNNRFKAAQANKISAEMSEWHKNNGGGARNPWWVSNDYSFYPDINIEALRNDLYTRMNQYFGRTLTKDSAYQNFANVGASMYASGHTYCWQYDALLSVTGVPTRHTDMTFSGYPHSESIHYDKEPNFYYFDCSVGQSWEYEELVNYLANYFQREYANTLSDSWKVEQSGYISKIGISCYRNGSQISIVLAMGQ